MTAQLVATVKLDPITGDLYEERGNLVIISGVDAIKQTLLSRLRTFKGEVFTDEDKGVPWLESILAVKGVSLDDIGGILRRHVLASPGVIACGPIRLTMDDRTRALAVTFTAKASTGESVVVSEEAI